MSAQSDTVSFSAKYYDGRQAIAHRVHVQLSGTALMIVAENGTILDTWVFDDIELGDRSEDWVRVAKKDSEARLSLNDPRAFDVLHALSPNMMTRQKRLRRGMLWAVASTIAVIIGIYFSIPLFTKAIVAVIPQSVESRMGQSAASAIENVVSQKKGDGVCSASASQPALDKMVSTLANYTDGPFTYNVQVLKVDMANAIALPGGYIFIFKGLLDEAESAEEVAGVLAHEMAHVDLRHSLHSMIHQTGLSVLADMMFGGSSFGGVSSFMLGASYTREAEEAADDRAIQTLRAAGISTQGFAAFFERLHAREKKVGFAFPDFMSTHPPSDKRAALAQATLPSRYPILSTEEWQRLKRICDW